MRISSIFHSLLLCGAVSLSLCSCNEPKFKVSGEIAGASDTSVVLEKSDFHGRWIAVDSAKVSSSGAFSIKADAPASPEIYRLSLGDRFIYFPVDSVESITVNSPADKFGTDFTVTGTDQAEKMASFEKELMALDINNPEAVTKFKRDVYNKYLKDARGSIISYYVLTKTVNGKPLYDPLAAEDTKYYAAVATAFKQFRPDDPHAGMLEAASIDMLKKKNSELGKKLMIHAQEITIFDIDLPDENGNNVKLSDLTGKGKPVAVIFGMMNLPESPAFNIALSELYNRLGGAVEFYHVSFDSDQYQWRDAARNLRWTTVIDPAGTTSDALSNYNVGTIPAFFIYDRSGSLADRAESIEDLGKKLSKY